MPYIDVLLSNRLKTNSMQNNHACYAVCYTSYGHIIMPTCYACVHDSKFQGLHALSL